MEVERCVQCPVGLRARRHCRLSRVREEICTVAKRLRMELSFRRDRSSMANVLRLVFGGVSG